MVVLSIVVAVLVAFAMFVFTWHYFVRGLPIKYNGIWFPPIIEVNSYPPIGAILPFFGRDEDLPKNWIVCKGQEVPKNSSISIDANTEKEGNQLPDLRDNFVRGSRSSLEMKKGIVKGGSDESNLRHSHLWAQKDEKEWWSYDESGKFRRVDDWNNGIDDEGEGNRPLNNDLKSEIEKPLKLYTNAQGEATADNRPAFVELRYIIRVR